MPVFPEENEERSMLEPQSRDDPKLQELIKVEEAVQWTSHVLHSFFTPQPSGLEGYCRHGPGGRAGGLVGGRAVGRAAARLAEPISL